MKKLTILLVTLLISLTSFAQNGINYKAVIKDSNGNVVANQNIDVKFSILQGATDVYREFHTQTTDANGIIILNIGEGTPSLGVFNDIDWASDDHFLKVEVDIERDGSFVFMGTTQFKTVPYAQNAANVSGMEKITENAKTGWRLKDQNAANYGDIGAFAVDLSISLNPSTTLGATGNFSTALGGDTKASGDISFASGNLSHAMGLTSSAMGKETIAQGDFSTATGLLSKAIGNTSFAMGFNTTANGFDSVSMGNSTKADASTSLAIGRYNTGGGNATNWILTDPIFEIGIGTSSANKFNALTVLKNGTITAPSLTNTLIDNAGNKALLTKEYADVNYKSSNVVTKKIVIPAAAFVSASSNYVNLGSEVYINSSSNEPIYAPLILPVGAAITEIKAYILDNDAVYNLEFTFNRTHITATSLTAQITLSTSGSSTSVQALTWTGSRSITDDAQYVLRIMPSTGHVWNPFNHSVRQIHITYTE